MEKMVFELAVILSFRYHLNREVFSISSSPPGQNTVLKQWVNKICLYSILICFLGNLEWSVQVSQMCYANILKSHTFMVSNFCVKTDLIHPQFKNSYHPSNICQLFVSLLMMAVTEACLGFYQTLFRELVLSNRQTSILKQRS